MRCETCGYSLFNLTVPRCPECNAPFDVTHYTFTPGSVLFGCPHCDQLYQGNDPSGLPSPRDFTCTACHQPVHVSSMRVLPVSDKAVGLAGEGLPWEVDLTSGRFQRWWQTCTLGMFHPETFYRRLRHTDDVQAALGFAAMSALFSVVLASAVQTALMMGFLGSALSISLPPTAAVWVFPLAVLADGLSSGMQQAAALFGGAGMFHLGIRLVGISERRYSNTLVVLAYATCPAIWALVPVVGIFIFAVWSLLVSVKGLTVVHNLTMGQTILASLLPGLILIALLVGSTLLLVF
jgi:hypothetical protein